MSEKLCSTEVGAVCVDKRELAYAFVGGGSNIPLALISLSENLAIAGVGIWIREDWFAG